MNSVATAERVASDDMKWGYAVAGGCAVAFAAVIQFAFGGLDEEMLSNLPAIVTVPYTLAGKLGITLTLLVVGMCLIARDVLVNQAMTADGPAKRVAASPKRKAAPSAAEEELPIAEEVEPTDGKKPGQKIAAMNSRFDGRRGGTPDQTGGPTGGANPTTPSENDGQMLLASAKYLNRGSNSPGNSLRKGTTNHTSDE
jgi:hypothetical protein